MTFPAIPVTEERGAATERVPTAGCCGGGRGRRWLAAQTERGEAAASGGVWRLRRREGAAAAGGCDGEAIAPGKKARTCLRFNEIYFLFF
jgi:hypothetical protein